MKAIPLVRRDGSVRAFASVDDEDYERLVGFRWYVNPVSHSPSARGYAVRKIEVDGRKTLMQMHRQILGLSRGDGLVGDHINRDTLDNRRSNLRVLTPAESMQNRGSHRGAKSRFRGVEWCSAHRNWRVRPRINGRRFNVGTFTHEVEAARAAESFRREHMPFAEPDPELLALDERVPA